ncbi:MAG: GIY-YIG nuclease family protein [Patescibacteria group bacterium]
MSINFYVYTLTNISRSTIYIGVTNNLERRVYEHKNDLVDGFSKKYKLHYLIYFEEYTDVREALAREKQLKNWHRNWKLNLIKQSNPKLKDLSLDF